MKKDFKKALFIFRRDLRLEDNTGLIFALEKAKKVIPCFIFTQDQIEHNSYRSDSCLQFMIESLEDLEKSLLKKNGKLHLFYGQPEKIIAQCFKELSIDAVIFNKDYTPYSLARDQKILKACKELNIPCHSFEDALLNSPEETLKKDKKPYTIFTPFYRNSCKITIPLPTENPHEHYCLDPISFASDNTLYQKVLPSRSSQKKGGRMAGLEILKNLQNFSCYASSRDFLAKDATTHLSSHLKFTTCSIREIYWSITKTLGPNSELIRSLYWRDFFTCIAFYFPRIFSGAFHSKFNNLHWNLDKETFKRWCEGTTGFPIIDAGMRELNQTGFMHNRARMITASFLVKDLHIDWRWGEKYFASKLIDYDPAVNNGNWQWAASTGCDAQPYFRVFNPWLQASRFDPDCSYIKRWIPELNAISPNIIHKWHLEKHHSECPSYPPPIVDHAEQSKIALASYKKLAT